ncbi:MAG TPA: NADH-quinone oxidoreductase subunit M [Pirellulales bacterium]|jgi:NADH-quinone oxidoreductase subunit M|nr:NADH-quinone oxidoreductase subunit M [Pirellulales bacterium]
MSNLLLATIFLPTIGAGFVWAVAPGGQKLVRLVALVVSLITLVLAGCLVFQFPGGAEVFAGSSHPWLHQPTVNIQFSLGIDGLSVWMFGLSALLSVTAVLVSWEAIKDNPAGFFGLLLLLETGMLGVFAARDILLFYVFFEFTLIPLFFLIGIWGSEDRRYAAIKFFLFTLAGSLLTFLGLLAIVLWNHAQTGVLTFSIAELTQGLTAHPIDYQIVLGGWSLSLQIVIFFALFAGFAIKVPLFPLHTWLPLAHVQAPTAGSVILAGILLKIGTYGFLRFSVPMLPYATAVCMPFMLWLSVAGIIYGALVALAQADIKRLIAYSSVSHLGFCMLGIFTLNRLGTEGGVLQMINHGLSTGGLFAIVGMIYERYHTRQISELGGLTARTPRLAFMMILFTMSSIGLPGLNGFAGEFLILIGSFQRGFHDAPLLLSTQLKWISVLAVSGVVLGAWYMLWLIQRVFFGPLKEPAEHGELVGGAAAGTEGSTKHAAGPLGSSMTVPVVAAQAATSHGHPGSHDHGAHDHGGHGAAAPPGHSSIRDLSFREFAALAPLIVFVFWIGLQPEYFREKMSPSIAAATQAAAQQVAEEVAAPGATLSGAAVRSSEIKPPSE